MIQREVVDYGNAPGRRFSLVCQALRSYQERTNKKKPWASQTKAFQGKFLWISIKSIFPVQSSFSRAFYQQKSIFTGCLLKIWEPACLFRIRAVVIKGLNLLNFQKIKTHQYSLNQKVF